MPKPPTKRSPHAHCVAFIVDFFAARDIEVTASELEPIVPTPYEDLAMLCPHGARMHAEPTSDQIAQWAVDGVD